MEMKAAAYYLEVLDKQGNLVLPVYALAEDAVATRRIYLEEGYDVRVTPLNEVPKELTKVEGVDLD